MKPIQPAKVVIMTGGCQHGQSYCNFMGLTRPQMVDFSGQAMYATTRLAARGSLIS